jgi:Putative adhesin
MTEWDGDTRRQEFDTPEPIRLTLVNMAGTVEVLAGDQLTTTVEVRPIAGGHVRDIVENTEIEMSADSKHLVVMVPERRLTFGRFPRVAVVVRLPEDSAVALRSASSEVRCTGRLARFDCRTASGELDIAEVSGPVDIKAASGDIRLGRVGAAQVRTASSTVRIAHTTGDSSVKVASGRIEVGVAEQSLEVRSASGDVTVDEVSSGHVLLKVTSGNIRVGVRAGVAARLDVSTTSGRARSELPVHDTAPAGGPNVELSVRATSGNVLVTKAAARDAA